MQAEMRILPGFDGIRMVLSGMSDLEMVKENCGFMSRFQPLTPIEQAAVEQVCAIFREQNLIPCTACRYCTDGCPKQIPIPDLFACMNNRKLFNSGVRISYYPVYTQKAKPSDCVNCGQCEAICPQKLPIRQLLADVVKEFET
jgi:predicted aldo/keto reductase-like oxidoreductase